MVLRESPDQILLLHYKNHVIGFHFPYKHPLHLHVEVNVKHGYFYSYNYVCLVK